MDANHYNELIDLSQGIYDEAAEKLTNYISARYCAVGNDTADEQLEDYLFVAEETSAFMLGNALALLNEDAQEEEILKFTGNLRRIIRYAQQQAGSNGKPN